MFKPNFLLALLVSSVVVIAGCSTTQFTNLFFDYAQQMKGVRSAHLAGDLTQAQSLIPDAKPSQTNYTLHLLEKARLNYLTHNWQQSREQFSQVSAMIEEDEAKAKLRLSQGVANVASLVSSDNALRYEVPAYEQSMLHSYQALNYVFLHQLESALVEIRRANLVQEKALLQYQKELDDGESQFNKNALKGAYPSMESMIGSIKNGFQNAYTFYLSAVLYEANGQANDAYIDYKKALEIYPNNPYVQQDVLRLATQLSMTDDLTRLTALYGPAKPMSKQDYGEVVVMLERGVINAKDELSIALPIFNRSYHAKYFSFALPVYHGALVNYKPITINVADSDYPVEQIARLQALASKELQQQLPALMTRQALRIVAKEQVRRSLSKEGGDLGNILATLYNIASEQADTRSWSTLPDEVQIARFTLPVGTQSINLKQGENMNKIDIEVKAKQITLVNVTANGSFYNHKVTNL